MRKRNKLSITLTIVGFVFIGVSVYAGSVDKTNLISGLSLVGAVVSLLIALVFLDFKESEKKNEK